MSMFFVFLSEFCLNHVNPEASGLKALNYTETLTGKNVLGWKIIKNKKGNRMELVTYSACLF
jgi:hypothetical protein